MKIVVFHLLNVIFSPHVNLMGDLLQILKEKREKGESSKKELHRFSGAKSRWKAGGGSDDKKDADRRWLLYCLELKREIGRQRCRS
jgi:hypothetical protein